MAQVCDKAGDPCNELCGGAGCGKCGGLSCDEGAVTKAQNALKFAKDTEKLVQDKETKIGELYRGVGYLHDNSVCHIFQVRASDSKSKKCGILKTRFSMSKNRYNLGIFQYYDNILGLVRPKIFQNLYS